MRAKLIFLGMDENIEGMHHGAKPHIFGNARKLRRNQTLAEKVLWEKLSNKQLGVRFRRQHPTFEFILDFYCHSARLAVELDGSVHDSKENQEYDENRTQILNELGIRVIRFRNEDVFGRLEEIITEIKNHLQSGTLKSL